MQLFTPELGAVRITYLLRNYRHGKSRPWHRLVVRPAGLSTRPSMMRGGFTSRRLRDNRNARQWTSQPAAPQMSPARCKPGLKAIHAPRFNSFTEAGIIALSLARSLALQASGRYYEIPSSFYPPIEQAAVVLSRSSHKETARQFLAFLKRPEVGRMMQTFGFVVP